jgi:hypothetical protein
VFPGQRRHLRSMRCQKLKEFHPYLRFENLASGPKGVNIRFRDGVLGRDEFARSLHPEEFPVI